MLRARFTRADLWSLGVLVALPVLLNATWALAGHPVLDGDNLTQNYPLRVYAGQLLAHGRLPLWDAGIWSGVPLLAGWNAGAMFPGTWLFAFLPGVAAYEVNMVVTGVVCGVGLHLFLRRQGRSPLAGLLGALSFSEMGFFSGQQCHLGLIEGTAMVPWMLLALDGIWRTGRWSAATGQPLAEFARSASHWIALLGLATGLSVLAGDPRAVSSDLITAAIWVGACCWRDRRLVGRLLVAAAAGVMLGTAIGTVQWLPGLSYLHGSQRAAGGLSLFGFGSLGWGSLPLLFTPYIAGGNGNLGMPDYLGPLNTPEVTFAVGILPLVALFALVPRLWRRQGRLGVWYVMFAVGVVLATGTRTPLGDVLAHVPLYGGQRLQNRNMAISDLALCALLAIFVDRLRPVAARAGAAGAGAAWKTLDKVAGSVPIAAVLGLIGAMFAFPRTMQRFLGTTSFDPHLATGMWPYLAAAGAISLAGLVVLWRQKWAGSNWRTASAAVVVADVVVFIVMASYQPIPLATLERSTSSLSALMSHLPAGTRYAIDDPEQLALDFPPELADNLGVDDLGLLHGVVSVQGYGSAVPAPYEAATGTHDVENLLPDGFLGPTYDELDLSLVVVVPDQFGRIIETGASPPIPPGKPVPLGASTADRQPGDVARTDYPPSGPWYVASSGQSTSWQLPAPARITSASVRFESRYGPLPASTVIVARLRNGTQLRARASLAGDTATARLDIASETSAGGVLSLSLAGAPSDSVVGAVTVQALPGTPLALRQRPHETSRYVLDGVMQGIFAPPKWRYVATIGPLVLYRNTGARGQAWLEDATATTPSAPKAPGKVTSLEVQPWQDPVQDVTTTAPSLLVWSEQYAPGWSAEVRPLSGGKVITEHSRRIGLIQGVPLGKGSFVVTWHYSSTKATVGLLASGCGAIACVVLLWMGFLAWRRRSVGLGVAPGPSRRRVHG